MIDIDREIEDLRNQTMNCRDQIIDLFRGSDLDDVRPLILGVIEALILYMRFAHEQSPEVANRIADEVIKQMKSLKTSASVH